jgi:hypothetical protein
MANPEHLQILEQGVEAWNAWREQHKDIRPDLSEAIISMMNLARINFVETNLTGATIDRSLLTGAYFTEADLTRAALTNAAVAEANFGGATLTGAILRGSVFNKANFRSAILRGSDFTETSLALGIFDDTDLTGAILTRTILGEAFFIGATLTGANLSNAFLGRTIFSNANLTAVRGLRTCHHEGPSTLDHGTLAQSGPLPLAFLRGCGLRDWEIEVAKLYQPGLTPTQINDIIYRIYGLRADPLIQFHSCFISYASRDHAFAKRLHADLQNKGVRCWFAPEDMKIGDRIRPRIDETIRLYDKLLLVLFKTSVVSQWVEQEVETTLERERQQGTTILFPVRIDNTVMTLEAGWPALIRNTRNIGDFRRWKTHDG